MLLLRQSSTGFLKEKACGPSLRVARGQDLRPAIYSPVHFQMGWLPFICLSATSAREPFCRARVVDREVPQRRIIDEESSTGPVCFYAVGGVLRAARLRAPSVTATGDQQDADRFRLRRRTVERGPQRRRRESAFSPIRISRRMENGSRSRASMAATRMCTWFQPMAACRNG